MEPPLCSQILATKNGEGVKDDEPPKPINPNRFKQTISTFPCAKGFANNMYHYQGFWFHPFFLEGILSNQEHFKLQPDDDTVFICSFPKTGTTWLKALCFAIATRSRFSTHSPLLTKLPHDCVPFLEIDLADNSPNNIHYADRIGMIPLVSTHAPYNCLPAECIPASGNCKIVYICRDPKDTFVSLWHFNVRKIQSIGKIEPPSFEEAFESFCSGIVSYGPYWDHVFGYWQASLEFPDRILFLKYEEMKRETLFYVNKLAGFLGCPFSLEEEEGGVVQKIIDMCCFENLSNLEVNKSGKHRADTEYSIQNNVFFRKGEVGDWKNYLTAEMGARLDGIMEEKLKGSGLTFK